MVLGILKPIVLIERHLPSRRQKRFEPLMKNPAKKMMKMMVIPW